MSTQPLARTYNEHYRAQTVEDLINTFREHADRLAHVMNRVKKLAPDSILDIACNRGLFGRLVKWRHGYSPRYVVGVDFSTEVLDEALATGYTAVHEVDVRTAFDLRLYFDLVLCMEILEHVPNPQVVILNALRHARKHVIFSVPAEEGEVDGVFHLRVVPRTELERMIRDVAEGMHLSVAIRGYFLPSLFCEKPKWQGWNFVEVEVL